MITAILSHNILVLKLNQAQILYLIGISYIHTNLFKSFPKFNQNKYQVTLKLAKILIRLKKKKDKLPMPWIAVMLLRNEWSDHSWPVHVTFRGPCGFKDLLFSLTHKGQNLICAHSRTAPPGHRENHPGLQRLEGHSWRRDRCEQSAKNCTWTGTDVCEQLHVSYGMKGDSAPLAGFKLRDTITLDPLLQVLRKKI